MTYCMIPFMWNSRKDKTIVTKHIGGHLTEKDMREFFGVMEIFYILIIVK